MKNISGLQATPFQTFSHSLSDGTIEFSLTYRPAIQKWYLDVDYNDFSVKGLRVCRNLNLLFQWYKIIPFGINIESLTGTEPFLIDDFSSGRIEFNILDEDEINEVVEIYKTARDLL